MSRLLMTLLFLLSALNVIALVLNLSQVSRAAVGGMNYQDLLRDPDFTRAVKSPSIPIRAPGNLARSGSNPGVVKIFPRKIFRQDA